jgi:hypothetical protein
MNKKSKSKKIAEKKILKIYNKYLNEIKNVLGDKTTTNIQINQYCFNNIKGYKGCFPYDLMPKLKNNQCVIINIDDSTQSGTHWVGIYKKDNTQYCYDSFGRNIVKIIPKLNQLIFKNSDLDAEQDVDEQDCGQRCISWLKVCNKYGIGQALLI